MVIYIFFLFYSGFIFYSVHSLMSSLQVRRIVVLFFSIIMHGISKNFSWYVNIIFFMIVITRSTNFVVQCFTIFETSEKLFNFSIRPIVVTFVDLEAYRIVLDFNFPINVIILIFYILFYVFLFLCSTIFVNVVCIDRSSVMKSRHCIIAFLIMIYISLISHWIGYYACIFINIFRMILYRILTKFSLILLIVIFVIVIFVDFMITG